MINLLLEHHAPHSWPVLEAALGCGVTKSLICRTLPKVLEMSMAGGDLTDPAERAPEEGLRLRLEGVPDLAPRGVLDLDLADWEGDGERCDD